MTKRFIWTNPRTGLWTGHGYTITRGNSWSAWRMLRDGNFWDSIHSLRVAKRLCEEDFVRRNGADQ